MSHRTERSGGEYVLATGAVLAGLGVAAGAFGAHALKTRLGADELDTWKTAANYQIYHALAVVVAARLLGRFPSLTFRLCCGLFIAGIVLFSGSLYLLALTGKTALGAITPVGGVALLAGWASMAAGILRSRGH